MVRFARQPVILSRPWSENIEIMHATPTMALEEMQTAILEYIASLGIDNLQLTCTEKTESKCLCFGRPKKYTIQYKVFLEFDHVQFNLGTIKIREWSKSVVSAIWKDQPIELKEIGMFHARIKKVDLCRGCKKLATLLEKTFVPKELIRHFGWSRYRKGKEKNLFICNLLIRQVNHALL